MLRKSILPTLLVISFFNLGMGLARADETHIAGSTTGAFDTGTPSGLTYTSSIFDVWTAGGFAAIGDAPALTNFNNLGSFALTGDPATFGGHTFTLAVTFSLPLGITGGSSAAFTATLTGTVASARSGGVDLVFGGPQTFHFTNGTSTGSFTFLVLDVSLSPGEEIQLTGIIEGASNPPVGVPEPSLVLLLGTGLIGLAITVRRKIL